LTGEQLAAWRLAQPGRFIARNGENRTGWTQEQCAEWYGCNVRTWRRFESGQRPVPLPLVKRIEAYGGTLEEIIDRMFETPKDLLDKWGSPFKELEHEDSESKDITRAKSANRYPPTIIDGGDDDDMDPHG